MNEEPLNSIYGLIGLWRGVDPEVRQAAVAGEWPKRALVQRWRAVVALHHEEAALQKPRFPGNCQLQCNAQIMRPADGMRRKSFSVTSHHTLDMQALAPGKGW